MLENINMSERIPQRFFGLHAHTGFSTYDGLGYPEDHFKFCIENGLDGLAITEHGSKNSYAHAMLWTESYNKANKDKKFLYIPGVEAYFHPDLSQWQKEKEALEACKTDAKKKKRLKIGEEAQTNLTMSIDANEDVQDIDMSNALVIESEEDSKNVKNFNPINRRHHLVLLPKRQSGLLKLFWLVSQSYLKGFYKFPRIDSHILREAAKDGDLIASTACIAGPLAFEIFQVLRQHKFDELDQKLLDDSNLMNKCVAAASNSYDLLTDCLGKENVYLELQFNKLPAQNLVNRVLLEIAKRNGMTDKLIATCDSHYFNPDVWKERELYKKLGFMNYRDFSPDSLPKSKEDLKCELYPKNAVQMWEEYKRIKSQTNFYDDDLIADAIERTHDIAHQVIGEIKPDRTPKFPNAKLVPPGEKSFNHLVKLCKEGMIKRGLEKEQIYIDRLKEELGVIKAMKNADYFISYQKIMELARKVVLTGPARGCFVPETKIMLSDGSYEQIKNIAVGSLVVDAFGVPQWIIKKFEYDVNEFLVELTFDDGRVVRCTKDHKFLTEGNNWVQAEHLCENVSRVIDIVKTPALLVKKAFFQYVGKVYDLCVSCSHTYNVERLAVHNSGGGSLVAYVLHITDLDPIKWELPFSRFLSVYRVGAPDIDCVHEDHLIVMHNGTYKRAGDISVFDRVLGGDGRPHAITATYSRKLYEHEHAVCVRVRTEDGTLGHIVVVPMHKFVLDRGNIAYDYDLKKYVKQNVIVYCKDLKVGDKLLATVPVEVVDITEQHKDDSWVTNGNYVDITVEGDHRFHIVPFDVDIDNENKPIMSIGYRSFDHALEYNNL